MATKILFVAFLSVTAVSATGCCRGFNIFQYRRPGLLPMYENPPPCPNFFGDQEQPCENPMFQPESVEKFDEPDNRFYSPYMEPKNVPHKCVCGKSLAAQRMMPNFPRYYKRGYYPEPMAETIPPPCGPVPCGQFGGCMQFGQCGQFDHCAQYDQYPIPPPIFRHPPHRVLPLTLPASCVC